MKMIKYMYLCIKHLYVSFSLSVCLMKCNNSSCIHFMLFKLVKLNFKSTYFRQIFAERISGHSFNACLNKFRVKRFLQTLYYTYGFVCLICSYVNAIGTAGIIIGFFFYMYMHQMWCHRGRRRRRWRKHPRHIAVRTTHILWSFKHHLCVNADLFNEGPPEVYVGYVGFKSTFTCYLQ